jgi:hypothetical protein
LALSFAESTGCQDIWERLCAVRGVDPDEAAAVDDTPKQSYHQALPKMDVDSLSMVRDKLLRILFIYF